MPAEAPEEVARRKEARSRFNPAPGTSYADRAERALRGMGQPASYSIILARMKQDDREFVPKGKEPISTLRIMMSKDGKGRFVKDENKLWGRSEWSRDPNPE